MECQRHSIIQCHCGVRSEHSLVGGIRSDSDYIARCTEFRVATRSLSKHLPGTVLKMPYSLAQVRPLQISSPVWVTLLRRRPSWLHPSTAPFSRQERASRYVQLRSGKPEGWFIDTGVNSTFEMDRIILIHLQYVSECCPLPLCAIKLCDKYHYLLHYTRATVCYFNLAYGTNDFPF